MIKYSIATLLFTVFFLTSCSDDLYVDNTVLPFEKIEYTRTCGWCVGQIDIEITKDRKVNFTRTTPCPLQINNLERSLTDEEFQSIKNVFDLENVLNVELDDCGACLDGCDETIILNSSYGHEHFIRYKHLSLYSELDEIEGLVNVLEEIRNSFN